MWVIFLLLASVLVRGIFTQEENEIGPRFRILAPQFVCPRDSDADAHNSEHSVVQFQMAAGSRSAIEWTVRWKSHAESLSQRTTLLLWRAVRSLETELNMTPPEPYTYVIRNKELLPGIDYLFNMTAVSPEGARGQSANFSIRYENGNRTLDLHDEPLMQNKFSMLLLGSETAYAHADYTLHSRVTTCRHTDDYHFKWTMKGITDPEEEIDVSDQIGGLLLIPAGTLRGGHNYDISCQLYQTTDGSFISKVGIFVNVERRGLRLQLGSDELVIGEGKPLQVFSHLYNYDDLPPPFVFEWSCTLDGEACPSFVSVDDDSIYLPDGFSDVGEYEIRLKATAGEESAEGSMRVVVVKPSLPVIQVEPTQRNLNEGTTVELVANVTNISPSCSLAWYFTASGNLARNSTNDTCEDCEHGEPLGETLNIYSLDEGFLNELADFSNESSSQEVRAQLTAASGRARLVASCGCSETFSCEAEGTAYADLTFKLNKSPVPADIMVSPGSGVALETVFRLSTRAVEELDPPVRYSFFYNFGNGTRRVHLASYINHVSHETILPYIDTTGVAVVVEVCDVWDACARSLELLVPTTAASPDVSVTTRLADTAAAQLRRCEMQQLGSLASSALISYNNAGQLEALEMFSSSLIQTLKDAAAGVCIQNHIQEYQDLIDLLSVAGLFDGKIKE